LVSLRAFALAITTSVVLILPATAAAQAPAPDGSGGAVFAPTPAPTPAPTDIIVPGNVAQLLPDGTAAAPANAPAEVQQAIFAANKIQSKPYVYGGGHAKVEDRGYDCSGTVSYALIGGGLLKTPLDSGSFMGWGESGEGAWITVYTNPGHAYAVIAGLRLDTSVAGTRGTTTPANARKLKQAYKKAYESGPRWRPFERSPRGYKKRHPVGF
jgi:hypothetical protein